MPVLEADRQLGQDNLVHGAEGCVSGLGADATEPRQPGVQPGVDWHGIGQRVPVIHGSLK